MSSKKRNTIKPQRRQSTIQPQKLQDFSFFDFIRSFLFGYY